MKKIGLALLIAALGISAMGCSKDTSDSDRADKSDSVTATEDSMNTNDTENNTDVGSLSNDSASDESGMLPANPGKDGVLVGELLDCVDYIGQTPAQIGIPESVMGDYLGSAKTYLDGTVLGNEDYAVLYFDNAASNPDSKAKHMWIHSKKAGYDELKTELIARYGEPTLEDMIPYVEVNDGAVDFCNFKYGEFTIKLWQSSGRSYTEIYIDYTDNK